MLPDIRSKNDDLTHDMIVTAFAEFAKEVRRYDQYRVISTGNSAPRPSAWHQWKEKSWTQDTKEQYAERLLLDNPSPADLVSIHLYEHTMKRFGSEVSVEDFLKFSMDTAKRAKKVLFVGEFGANATYNAQETKQRFDRILTAIEKTKVPIAALWVYDFDHQSNTWNVTTKNERAYQLKAISETNRRIWKEKGR